MDRMRRAGRCRAAGGEFAAQPLRFLAARAVQHDAHTGFVAEIVPSGDAMNRLAADKGSGFRPESVGGRVRAITPA